MTGPTLAMFAKVVITDLTQVAKTNILGIALHLSKGFFYAPHSNIVSLLILLSRAEHYVLC